MDRKYARDILADDGQRRITRYHLRMIKAVFPFLELPPELRTIVYTFSLSFSGVKNYFDKHYASSRKGYSPQKRSPKPARKMTPIVLLINRQISSEAIALFRKASIHFEHGMLEVMQLSHVISPTVLQKLRSIEISDAGHPILEDGIVARSWHGHLRLIEQISGILEGGHNLKSFTIHFTDPKLKEHVTVCWEATFGCGFRDGMRKAMESLKKIRGVPKVNLIGLNNTTAHQLQEIMQSLPTTFADLPREIRDMIYNECLDWSGISKQLVRSMANWTQKNNRFPYPKRTTPGLLLVNKQYGKEALEVLRAKPLIIDFPGNHSLDTDHIPNLAKFIGGRTLRNVTRLVLNLESWEWCHALPRLVGFPLAVKHNLKSLHIVLKDSLKEYFMATFPHKYPDATLHFLLKSLDLLRDVPKVTIDGDLPDCYTESLIQRMMAPNEQKHDLPGFKAIQDDDIVDVDDDDDEDSSSDEDDY